MHFLYRCRFLLFFALVFMVFALGLKAQQPKLIVPTGHVLSITDVDFNKSGKYMVTVAENEIKYWETETGRLIYNLRGNSYEGFTNNSKTLITTSLKNDSTGIVKFWDVATGNLIDSLPGITITMSKDSQLMMLSSGTDSVMVMQAKTKKKLFSLPGGLGTFINDDKHIFTASPLADDTGYHIMIWDSNTRKLLYDQNGVLSGLKKNLVVLEQDSTMQVIDLNKGEVVQRFNRPKIKGSDRLASYKMKFSPDQKLAMFFTDDKYVAVIDNETYALKQTIELKSYVKDLVFNDDGSIFMIVDKDSSATAYDGKTFIPKYQLKGHHNQINRLVFSEDNKFLLTSSYDKTAILWNATDGSFIRTFSGKNQTINKAVLSDDGKFLAQQSGSRIYLWETATAKKITSLVSESDQIRFSSDSKFLIVNQNYYTGTSDFTTKIIDAATGKLVKEVASNTDIGNCTVSADGKYLLYLNKDKNQALVKDNQDNEVFNIKAKSGQKITGATFSNNNQQIVIAYAPIDEQEKNRLLVAYNLSAKQELWSYENQLIYNDFKVAKNNQYLIARMAADSLICLDMKTGKATYVKYVEQGIRWTDREINSTDDGKYVWIINSTRIVVFDMMNSKQVLERKNESWISFATVTKDEKLMITDDENRLLTYQLPTGKLIQTIATRGDTYGWSDGILLTNDKTFLHIYKDSKLLYSLLALGEQDQLVVDPNGRYDGTELARKLLYFTCGTEIISLDQVKDLLWVPNLTERITKGEVVNAPKLSDLQICGLTPEVETIESKTDDYQFKITPRKGGLGETVLYINDIEVKRFLPAQLVKSGIAYMLKISKASLTTYLTSNKENQVTVKAYTAKNDISSRGAKVSNLKSASTTTAPNLYAVVVGVSDYKGTELDLKYAAKDANDIAKAIGFSSRKLLNTDGKEHVFIYNLNTSKDATFPEKLSIKNAIADVAKKATANDIFMVFFAGHGVMEGTKKQFYFLTADASKESLVPQVGISTTELSEWMKPANIKAQKRILIFDACNSGQAVNELVKIGNTGQQYLAARNDDHAQQIKAIEKLNEKSGLFILSASASNQSAYEMGKYSQGLLTYALLKAMKEQPDILDENKFLNVGKWFSAAEKTVTDLVRESGNRQEPQVVSTSNFNIGIVDQDVMAKIMLPQENVLFSSSNFQNNDETIADDDLELSKAINLSLNSISSRGVGANISFVQGTNSPDAYSLSGRYEIKNDTIVIKVNVRKNKELKHNFEVTGQAKNIAALADEIVKQAMAFKL